MKPLVVILTLLCLGLAAQVFLRQTKGQKAEKDLRLTTSVLLTASNDLAETKAKLDDESRLAAYLQSNLTQRATDLALASNSLTEAASSLSTVQGDLKSAQAEVQKNSARVTELEGQRDEMQAKLNELAGSIKNLNVQIAETKRKLASAEGDRDSLTKELARLQSDKSDLLRQFNDLAALKAQVALLKEESAVNQRLSWMAQGVYHTSGRKGAEALAARPTFTAVPVNPGLNVELQQRGGSRVNSTNAAPSGP
jgi:peptidoglycan hydrolase CwlO-like protein